MLWHIHLSSASHAPNRRNRGLLNVYASPRGGRSVFILTMAACLAVLLVSNIWLLKEIDALRARVKAYRDEVLLLNNQLCRLMAEIEGRAPFRPSGDDGDCGRGGECDP